MRVLITGIAGFVGSSIARGLLELGYEVTGIDDFSAGYLSRVQDFAHKIKIEVGKQEDILKQLTLHHDVIVNCAANAPLPASLLKAEVDKVAYADLTRAKSYGFQSNLELKDGLKKCLLAAKEYFR